MPRKKRASLKRDAIPDPKFGDKLVAKLVNTMMWGGKKSTAEHIVYGSFDVLQEKKNDDPIKLFKQAMENIKPIIEVRSRRVGGASYQVPMQVNRQRQQSLAIRWILQSCHEKKGKAMHVKLADELLAAYNREGAAMTKRENVHRMAEANRAFAHFAW